MNKPEKVLRYDLTATDGSGRHLIQYALPGCDFETAESLETDGLIKREFTDGKWTTTKGFAPDDIREQFGNSTSMNKIAYTAGPRISLA